LNQTNILNTIDLIRKNYDCSLISKFLGIKYNFVYMIKNSLNYNINKEKNFVLKRGRINKYDNNFLTRLDDFISKDENRYLIIKELKIKFENYMIEKSFHCPKMSLSSFYRIILSKKHLNYDLK